MRVRQFVEWGIMILICVIIGSLAENVAWSEYLVNYEEILEHIPDAGMELFYAQASLTFISVSVLTMLSDKSIFVFWEDQVEKRLIEPKGFSFLSLTGYSFVLLASSFCAVVFGKGKIADAVAITFFILNIVVLGILTFEMCGLFFNREYRMKRLQGEFDRTYYKYYSCDENFIAAIENRINEFHNAMLSEDVYISKREKRLIYAEKEICRYIKYTESSIKDYLAEVINNAHSVVRVPVKKVKNAKILIAFLKEFGSLIWNYRIYVLKEKFFSNKKIVPLEDFRELMRDSSKINDFTLKKSIFVIKTSKYVQDGEVTQLIENLKFMLDNCVKFDWKDYSSICRETTDITRSLLFTELFMPMAEMRNILDENSYWNVVNRFFPEESYLLADYYIDDAREAFIYNEDSKKLNKMDYALTQLIRLAKSILQKDDNFSCFERKGIIDGFKFWGWTFGTEDFILTLKASRFLVDNEKFLHDNCIVTSTETGFCDITNIYVRYLNGIKRIMVEKEKEEAISIFDAVLDSYDVERNGYKRAFDIYVEGVIFELEQEKELYKGYDYNQFYLNFNKKVDEAMVDNGLSVWNKLSADKKANNSSHKYCYVSGVSSCDPIEEAILEKIGNEMYFGEELLFDEKEMSLWLYTYYKGYIVNTDYDKIKLFVFEDGVKKYYNMENIFHLLKETKKMSLDMVKAVLEKRLLI